MNLSTIMDAIATAAEGLTPQAYSWPSGAVNVPCVVVGYPTDLDFDVTFKRGADRAVFPVYFLVGDGTDKNSRDALSEVIDGAVNIKNTLDGDLNGAIQTGRVMECRIEQVEVSGIAYLSATFDYEVYA